MYGYIVVVCLILNTSVKSVFESVTWSFLGEHNILDQIYEKQNFEWLISSLYSDTYRAEGSMG